MLKGWGAHTVVAGRDGSRNLQTRANFVGGIGVGATGASQVTAINKPTQVPILDGMVNTNDDAILRMLYRDIYLHDPISGSTVDLMGNLPFGDFSLSGVPDAEILDKFRISCDRMRIKSFLPVMSNDYLVEGAFLGALNWDSTDMIFEGIIPHNMDFAEMTFLPTFGKSPIVNLRYPPELKKLMTSQDPRVRKAAQQLPRFMQEGIMAGKTALNAENTLYLPRRSTTSRPQGTSFYRRILPIWLLEKALMRGTIEIAHRRQRAILHGIAGGEDWEPTSEELNAMAGAFMAADQDPVGATIFTRPDVMINEVQPGGEFWKIDDISEWSSNQKLRAFGISESFLSGEASASNAESTLTVFIQNIRAYRENITRAMFYEKIFPYITVANDFRKDTHYATAASMAEYENEMMHPNGKRMFKDESGNFFAVVAENGISIEDKDVNIKNFHMPVVTWHNQLRPEGDSEYLTRLQQMEQMGVPVPIRMIAAATGIDIGDIIHGMTEDIEVRKVLMKYREDIKRYKAHDEDEQQEVTAALDNLDKLIKKPNLGLKDREFDTDLYGPRNKINGTSYVVTPNERKRRNEAANRMIASAMAKIAERENAKTKGNHTVDVIAPQ